MYDGDNLIEEVNSGGTVTASYTQGLGIDETLADIRSGVTSYYEADGLGSTTSLTDTLGGVVATYEYDSFGNAVRGTEGGRASTTTRYTGRQFDPETGLYYYRARYYDSTIGRFISEDPIRFGADVNFYRYVSNNPLNQRDPTGQQEASAAGCLIGGPAGCVVGGAVDLLEGLVALGFVLANQQPNQCQGGKWHCTAKCPIFNFSGLPNIPDYVFGEGWGNSQMDAVLAAKANASSKAPRGTYTKHCNYKCEKR